VAHIWLISLPYRFFIVLLCNFLEFVLGLLFLQCLNQSVEAQAPTKSTSCNICSIFFCLVYYHLWRPFFTFFSCCYILNTSSKSYIPFIWPLCMLCCGAMGLMLLFSDFYYFLFFYWILILHNIVFIERAMKNARLLYSLQSHVFLFIIDRKNVFPPSWSLNLFHSFSSLFCTSH